MSSAPASPKRRHILSSINPDKPPKRRRSPGDNASKARHEGDDGKPRRSRLRLKGERSKHHRHRPDDYGDDASTSRRHRRRRHRSPTPPNPYDPPPLDADAAFRESLFDAMADDEGASYWEGVYGQPVHVYASELERMTEEEYAAHVRQKMWEKTHAGLLEERERREQRRKAAAQQREEDERSVRRERERRGKRAAEERWEAYERGWAAWDGAPESIPWPTRVNESDVRAFFAAAGPARLKDERVRWHPDKIQQRLAGRRVGEEVMRDVTVVFQVIDRLWSEMRES